MRRVISFGDYLFPDTQDQLSDNFTNTVPRGVRLPDLAGAFDELGMDAAPSESGNIKLKYLMLASSAAQVTQLRDDVRKLAGYGVRKLVVQPADQSLGRRYTYARIQNIQAPENAKRLDRWQEVNIDFFVSYPRWMQDVAPRITWGGGEVFGGGQVWGDSSGSHLVGSAAAAVAPWGGATWGVPLWGANEQTTLTYTNNGNAMSLPRLLFTCTDTATDGLTIERLQNGVVNETLSYTGPIAAGQLLDIDGPALRIELDGVAAYNDLTYTHPAWLRLAPGANTLRVTLPNGGGSLRVIYPHTWY